MYYMKNLSKSLETFCFFSFENSSLNNDLFLFVDFKTCIKLCTGNVKIAYVFRNRLQFMQSVHPNYLMYNYTMILLISKL